MKANKVKNALAIFLIIGVCCGSLMISCGGGSAQSSSSSGSVPGYVKVEIYSQYNVSSSDVSKIKGRKTQDAPGMEGWEGTMVLSANGSTLNWSVNVDK